VPVLVVRITMPEPSEHIASFVLDISELKAATAGRARLSAAIEQTSESVVVTDIDARITYVNPAFEQVSGYSLSEVLGQNPRVLRSGVQPAPFYRRMWATLLAGETWHGELVNQRKDGSLYTEDASISPIRDEAGAITAYVAVKRDITLQRDLEERLRQSQRLEAVGQLAGGVAHDFNNILAAVRGYAELATASLPQESQAKEDIEEVLRAADRGSAVTRQLLLFSRRQPLVPTDVEPASVIDALVPMLRRLIGEHIELRVEHGGQRGHVLVDLGSMEQVIVNLAVNARDAMPEGGLLRIETANVVASTGEGGEPAGPCVRISVTDTGTGMDDATAARAFEPFFTTKEPGKGTGLGLATVYGIVRGSGGRVSLATSPGLGCAFTIELPMITAAGVAEGHGASGEGDTSTESMPSGRVLLVEDDEAVRRSLARTLERLGYVVVAASSGIEALGIAAGNPEGFEILVSDVRMPGLQGHELARRIWMLRPGMPVILMSGLADEAGTDTLTTSGAFAVLDKPFDAATIDAAIRAALAAPSGRPVGRLAR
jgi:PAS domain S-box-containing protein